MANSLTSLSSEKEGGVFCLIFFFFSQENWAKKKKKKSSLRLLPVDAPCCDTSCKTASVLLKPEHERDALDMRNHNTREQQERRKRGAVSFPRNPTPGETRGIEWSFQLCSIHVSLPNGLPPSLQSKPRPFHSGKPHGNSEMPTLREVLPERRPQDQAWEVFPPVE